MASLLLWPHEESATGSERCQDKICTFYPADTGESKKKLEKTEFYKSNLPAPKRGQVEP
jgi:hypothetical protein